MTCCKCLEYKWDDPQKPVYTDNENREYCLFHAPNGEKGRSIDEVNKEIFSRIQSVDKYAINYCNLSGTIFPGDIRFSQFSNKNKLPILRLDHCIFTGKTIFDHAIFGGGAIFDFSYFSENAYFDSTTFKGSTAFNNVKFYKNVYFASTIFEDLAYFESSHFEGWSFFNYVEFNGWTSFLNATFNWSEFRNISINRGFDFWPLKNVIDSLTFIDTNLTLTNFLGTDVNKISFIRCKWPTNNGRYRINSENDEEHLEEVRDFYQRMKRKYKQEHNEAEVSQWHVSEKEVDLLLVGRDLKRAKGIHDRAIWGLLWLMLQLYRLSSRFGEHMVRAGSVLFYVAMAPLMILIAAKLIQTGWSPTFDSAQVAEVFTDWLRCIPLIKTPDLSANVPAWKLGLFGFFQLLIAVQAALFAFALRNRFRR